MNNNTRLEGMTKNLFIYLFSSLLFLFILSCGENNHAQQSDNMKVELNSDKTQSNLPADSKFNFAAYDTKGKLQQSSQWIGKQPVVINFWGTWCFPCRKEIPDLIKLYDEYRDKGIEIIGLAAPRREQPTDIQKFADNQGMDWPILIVDIPLAQKFSIESVPTTIFVDKNGKEIDKFIGYRSYEELKAAFEKIK